MLLVILGGAALLGVFLREELPILLVVAAVPIALAAFAIQAFFARLT